MTFVNSGFLRRAGIHSFPLLLAIIFVSGNAHAQDISRRPLEHKDYDVWNTISRSRISSDGNWVTYTVQNGMVDGEATLHIQNTKTARKYVIERGSGAQMTYDSRFGIYRITPEKKKVKQMRKEKKEADEMPKSKLQILELETGHVITIDNVDSFKMPKRTAIGLPA